MSVPEEKTVNHYRGDDLEEMFQVRQRDWDDEDAPTSPVDLTGGTIEANASVAGITVNATGPSGGALDATGWIEIHIPRAETKVLAETEFNFDVAVLNSSGRLRTYRKYLVILEGEVVTPP